MRKINANDVHEEEYWSPKRTMGGFGRDISIALGRKPDSTDLLERHPFDVEIQRIRAGLPGYPYHSHSAQWEFYYVLSGSGIVRDETGKTPVGQGDAFFFKPGEAHQLIGGDGEDLVVMCIADNPTGESCHYPDSAKWLVRSPERALIRSAALDYWDGEE
ncbi:MAG TPA: dimethylsulfonioproprionate lyase family protein [Verrucomicrobiae bacterium]|nr:dimethylsulfonioproprionate lyase family protein [Verrucomicrobiae bacterium]